MDFSLKKSFKSLSSLKHPMKTIDEEQSNLLNPESSDPNAESSGRREFVVKINEEDKPTKDGEDPRTSGSKIWRESSYDFRKDGVSNAGNSGSKGEDFDFQRREQAMDDPPSKLIGQFLHKQKASGEISLDMDLEMEELNQNNPNPTSPRNLTSISESPTPRQGTPREVRVSFEPPVSRDMTSNDSVRRRHRDSPEQQQQNKGSPNINDGEVVRCTSNASFQSIPSLQRLMKTKTKSRLMDPPDALDRRSGRVQKSGQLKSGFLGKNGEDEDDESLLEDDIPEDFMTEKLNLWVLLEWLSLILIIAALVCSLAIPFLRRKKLWDLQLWKWEVMVLVLICGRLVSSWVVRIIVFFIERNFLLRKRVLYFVYGIRKPVQNCLWLSLVLSAWHLLFDKRVARETNSKVLKIVTKILVCLLVATMLWLLKTLVIKVLASSFHVSTYFDRIQESLFNQFVIETLSGPPLIEIRKAEEDEEKIAEEVRKLQGAGATVPAELRSAAFLSPKAGRVIKSGVLQKSPQIKSARLSRASSKKEEDGGITIDRLHKWNPKNVSAWNMKRLMNIVRYGALSTLDEQILDSTHDDETATQIRSENEAKAAAKKIFSNVAKPGARYIYTEDLLRFMQEDEALKTMSLFEGASESRRISKKALKNWLVNAFRERRALALTLDDTKTAVNKLHHFVNGLVSVIIVVIWLLILGIATSKFLVFLSSQVLLVAFIFGNTCKTIFEAIIFLFVMHPFDVGDRCEIDGIQMVVEEMNILTTIFLRYDNQKIIFPNSVLATKPISNYYRSPDMGDAVEFCIHVATPAEKIAALKQRITSYIENVKKDHWYPAPQIVFKDVEELNRVRIAVWLTHKMNHQDMGERWERRALLLEEMVKIFKELDIEYRLYPLNISVRSMPPVTSERLPPTWTPNA